MVKINQLFECRFNRRCFALVYNFASAGAKRRVKKNFSEGFHVFLSIVAWKICLKKEFVDSCLIGLHKRIILCFQHLTFFFDELSDKSKTVRNES